MGGVGAATSLVGGIEEGKQQKSAYDYNADITLQNMQDQMIANQQESSAIVGKQASSYASAGVDIASGSPLLIMAATRARMAVKGQQIEEAGTEQAAIQRYQGKMAAFSGTMSGINSFLTGISKAASTYTAGTFNPSPSVFNPAPYGANSD